MLCAAAAGCCMRTTPGALWQATAARRHCQCSSCLQRRLLLDKSAAAAATARMSSCRRQPGRYEGLAAGVGTQLNGHHTHAASAHAGTGGVRLLLPCAHRAPAWARVQQQRLRATTSAAGCWRSCMPGSTACWAQGSLAAMTRRRLRGQLGSGSGTTCRPTCARSCWLASSRRHMMLRNLSLCRRHRRIISSRRQHHSATTGIITATTAAATAAASASSSCRQGLRGAQTTAVCRVHATLRQARGSLRCSNSSVPAHAAPAGLLLGLWVVSVVVAEAAASPTVTPAQGGWGALSAGVVRHATVACICMAWRPRTRRPAINVLRAHECVL